MKKLFVTVQVFILLLVILPARSEQHRIPLDSRGTTYTLRVLLNKSTETNFLLDTGASHTVITPELARRLELTEGHVVEHIPVVTANGRSTLPVVIIDSLRIGSYEITGVRAVVQDIEVKSSPLGGLLGMSALGGVDYMILRLRDRELLLQTSFGRTGEQIR